MLQREFQHSSTYETGLQVVQVMNDALNMKPKHLLRLRLVLIWPLETLMLSHAELHYCIKRLQFLAASHTRVGHLHIYIRHIYKSTWCLLKDVYKR